LATLEAMQPDVCLTAAYGKVLPKKFLEIPRCGTVNIHPSLLPKYRGAAPVQRALQVGCMCPLTCHLPVCLLRHGQQLLDPPVVLPLHCFCPLSSCADHTPAFSHISLPGLPCLAMFTTILQYLLQSHSFCCQPAVSAATLQFLHSESYFGKSFSFCFQLAISAVALQCLLCDLPRLSLAYLVCCMGATSAM